MNKSVYCVLGGDLRFSYLAELIARAGNTVFYCAAEHTPYIPDGVFITDVHSALKFANTVILPLPFSLNGCAVNAPYAENAIYIDDIKEELAGKTVFAGMAKEFPHINNTEVLDYYSDEHLLCENALLTAEGALAAAIIKYAGKISGTGCVITGYGRIAKALLKMLKALNADVYVAARNPNDRQKAQENGATAFEFEKLPAFAAKAEIIFNTVPAMVINESVIKNLPKNCVIIDLATAPGGTDFAAAAQYSCVGELMPGIPGKYSPLAAAQIIKDTVFRLENTQ